MPGSSDLILVGVSAFQPICAMALVRDDGTPCVAGRGIDADCRIDNRALGKSQFSVRVEGGLMIEDLASPNGTFVNGAKIKGPVAISVTDDIEAGRCSFRLLSAELLGDLVAAEVVGGPNHGAPTVTAGALRLVSLAWRLSSLGGTAQAALAKFLRGRDDDGVVITGSARLPRLALTPGGGEGVADPWVFDGDAFVAGSGVAGLAALLTGATPDLSDDDVPADLIEAIEVIVGTVIRTQAEADALAVVADDELRWPVPPRPADAAAVAQFEPPHREGSCIAVIVNETHAAEARLLRLVIDTANLSANATVLGAGRVAGSR